MKMHGHISSATQLTATARYPSSDGGGAFCPTAVGTHNPRSRETTRVTPFAHLHIGSFANYSLFTIHYSLGLSVDPMSGKYPSLSPYVYCANNPVKLVDPNGEDVSDGDPPKIFQTIGAFFSRLDNKVTGTAQNREFEGHSDPANQGTSTKQDEVVAAAVISIITISGTIAEADVACSYIIGTLSFANSIDDITTDASGQTASQRATANNPNLNTFVDISKASISTISTMSSTVTAFGSEFGEKAFNSIDAAYQAVNTASTKAKTAVKR